MRAHVCIRRILCEWARSDGGVNSVNTHVDIASGTIEHLQSTWFWTFFSAFTISTRNDEWRQLFTKSRGKMAPWLPSVRAWIAGDALNLCLHTFLLLSRMFVSAATYLEFFGRRNDIRAPSCSLLNWHIRTMSIGHICVVQTWYRIVAFRFQQIRCQLKC